MNEIILDRIFAEPIVVKTISAAWNEIRKIRNTTPADELNGQILTVTMPESLKNGRIPARILFRMNTKGKVEFKDADILEARAARKAAAAQKIQLPKTDATETAA